MSTAPHIRPQDLADETISLVRRWLAEAAAVPADASAARLAGVLRDPNGLDFTVGFVDGVVRPEDLSVAAKKLRELVPVTPSFLPAPMRGAISVGGVLSKPLPGIVVPIARRVLRELVSHLIIDASDAKLGPAISKIARDGVRLNMNLLGEAILGQGEAERRLAGTHRLLSRDDIDYVSIKVSATVAPHNHWAFDEAVDHIEQQLVPLFERAAAAAPQKFINLDMEEYKDLDLTLAVFTRILDRPEFANLEAGIVLQAYLPDALSAMMRLQEWSAQRVARGGAPIKVRVVKGANLPMELVDAAIHGWPSATWPTKQASDTGYKAVLDYALHPDRVRNVRIGVAGHNLFDVALAWLLAQRRSATDGIEFEMLLGMATGQAEAVRREVGHLLLYVPVVHPEEFDVAIAYLIRRLEEGASTENFMSAVFELHDRTELFERERERFLASLADLEAITADGDPEHYRVPAPNRDQDRGAEAEIPVSERLADPDVAARVEQRVAAGADGFRNTPDTDPDLPGNRAWGRAIAGRMVSSELGMTSVATARITDSAALDAAIERGRSAASEWQSLGADERARILHRAGEAIEARRSELLEVMGAECGKTLDQGDPEVSEAIDFAHYYAALGQELEHVDGARYVPQQLVAVIPPWNFPVAIPAGGVLAGLASGASVIIKPAAQSARSGAVMVEALWEAGVPRDALQLVQFGDRELASSFVADPRIDRLILTGAYETAETFRSLRQDLPILAETSGKNAIIVTPNADLDLAARDVAQSAFGHAGQKCSAASLIVLVGSVAASARFRSQLLDAVRSLRVGTPDQLTSQMGPMIAAPSGKLLRGLTELEPGQNWAIEPKPVTSSHPLATDRDGDSKLWSPGVRAGVQRGSEYHLTEYFGPILGIMTAESLDEAIDIVNDIEYGLTSGLHSLDRDELDRWLARIEAGNLYVNRGITGAIVRRQPFGGWKKSAIGAGTKAGGPSYLFGLGDWVDAPAIAPLRAPLSAAARLLTAAEQSGFDSANLAWLRAALGSDAAAWEQEFGAHRDASGIGIERNVLRYLPAPVVIRATADAVPAKVLRTVAAAVGAGSPPELSTPVALPAPMVAALDSAGVRIAFEDAAAWSARVAALAARRGPHSGARVRIVAEASRGEASREVVAAAAGKPDIAVYAAQVVTSGRVEMLPYLREQAVSITAHRFGTPSRLSEGIV
ncbi:proline dehydrogenase family protein [Leucobacter sp. NPDC077196]|uniref:proline dehydrogenase family protein n=1 Tax=Leucobacter sp. NPDC077196 TaxID=3154959 RepID=UPI003432D250